MVMAVVLRLGLGGLGGLGLWLIVRIRCRRGGLLRGVLCRYRQRHCKHDKRSCDNRTEFPGIHSILLYVVLNVILKLRADFPPLRTVLIDVVVGLLISARNSVQ